MTGLQLLQDYLHKMSVLYKAMLKESDGWYKAMLDVSESRERLEEHLRTTEPQARNPKGQFVKIGGETYTPHIKKEDSTQPNPKNK